MKKTRIIIVSANYYPDISNNMEQDVSKYLHNNYSENIRDLKKLLPGLGWLTINVPGVFEIPVTIAKNIKKCDAFIALGCVIKGKTAHFDLISQAVTRAIMDLSIKYKKPIGNGIIACFNKEQAMKRAFNTKKNNKGGEAARAVLSVLGILKNESK